jgi:imidazolonepropionase-like amidohydrolase
LTSLLTTFAHGQDLRPKAPPQDAPIAILGATIHPVTGPSVESGFIVFEAGVIKQIGAMPGRKPGPGAPAGQGPEPEAGGATPPLPPGTRLIDAKGLHVYPGLIASYSQLGITELGAVRATRDFNEAGGFSPEALPLVAVNPDSTLLPVARSNGVLLAGVFPSGGTVPGRVSVIRLDGWTWEEMGVVRDAGVVIQWPMTRVVRAWWMDTPEDKQRENNRRNLQRLREVLTEASDYARRAALKDATLIPDVRWEAMRPVFGTPARKGPDGKEVAPVAAQKPVFIQATDTDQIASALEVCAELAMRPIIVGGHDTGAIADELKRRDVGVILTGVLDLPRRDDAPYDEHYALAARLASAGVRFSIASGEETPHERNLPYAAAMSAAHGLASERAVASITIDAARMLGIAERYGSLEVGKSATLIVTTGSPLDVRTRVRQAFIDGRTIDLRNKQTDLAEKYREKYRQMRDQPAPVPAPVPAPAPAGPAAP